MTIIMRDINKNRAQRDLLSHRALFFYLKFILPNYRHLETEFDMARFGNYEIHSLRQL